MAKDFILCDAYKTAKKDETYLFVDKQQGLEHLPEELLAQFPNPELVTSFKLTAERNMARVDAAKVMQDIHAKGYFLQMPPASDVVLDGFSSEQAERIVAKNEKLKT